MRKPCTLNINWNYIILVQTKSYMEKKSRNICTEFDMVVTENDLN